MLRPNIYVSKIVILQFYLLSLAQGSTVIIDINSDLNDNGWTSDCVYFANADELTQCIDNMDQENVGFWTPCTTIIDLCEIIYSVSEMNALPQSIKIEAFMKDVNSDRVFQIRFKPNNGESLDTIRVSPFEGYGSINLDSLDDSLKEIGSTIIIVLSASNPQFVLVDKIIQNFALESTTNIPSSSTSSLLTESSSKSTEESTKESTVSSLSSISTIKSSIPVYSTSISTEITSSYSYLTSTTSVESSSSTSSDESSTTSPKSSTTSSEPTTISAESSITSAASTATSAASSKSTSDSLITSDSTLSTKYISSGPTLISSSTNPYSSSFYSFSTPTSKLSSILSTYPSTGSTNDLTSVSSNYYSTLSTASILPSTQSTIYTSSKSTDFSSTTDISLKTELSSVTTFSPTTNRASTTALNDISSTSTSEAPTSMHTSKDTVSTLPTTILPSTITTTEISNTTKISESTHSFSTEITTQISTIKPIIVDTKYDLEKSNWTTTCDYADETSNCLNGLESIIDGKEGIWTICQNKQTSCVFDYDLKYLSNSKVLPFIPSQLAINFYIRNGNGNEILKIEYESKKGSITKEYGNSDTWTRVEIDINTATPDSELRIIQESNQSPGSLVLIDKIELIFKLADDEDYEKSTSEELDNVHIILIAVSAILFMFLFVSIVALIHRKKGTSSFEELIDNEFNFGNNQSIYGSNTNKRQFF